MVIGGTLLCAQPLDTIAVTDIDGRPRTLAAFKSRVLLVVNVASECGLTGQYAGLQALFEKYASVGLTVLGFPCNQFGAQEPGTNAEIKKFCAANYRVTFPMFAKIEVKGAGRHPLYAMLAGKAAAFPGDVRWNFEKFLVGRDGRVLRRFAADVEPDADELIAAVEAALAAKP
ncbi:MAG: glutathione peroxidase [Opitutaceae bacterium]|nr:glutathione peroxidase [Opitutaceae bacterium]